MQGLQELREGERSIGKNGLKEGEVAKLHLRESRGPRKAQKVGKAVLTGRASLSQCGSWD